jgi:hypothetical protein
MRGSRGPDNPVDGAESAILSTARGFSIGSRLLPRSANKATTTTNNRATIR